MNRNQLATIHIVKKDVGLTDDQYRDLLFKVAGVRSAKDLQNDQFSAVLSAMQGPTNLRAIKFKPKEPKFSFHSSKPEYNPWTWITPTENQWNNQIAILNQMEKEHKAMVIVWGADGSKRFKVRPMIKGRDY